MWVVFAGVCTHGVLVWIISNSLFMLLLYGPDLIANSTYKYRVLHKLHYALTPHHALNQGKFSAAESQYHASRVLLGIQHLHDHNIVYRCGTRIQARLRAHVNI